MNNLPEDVNGYSTFTEIDNRMLRAYNQYSVLTNMKENNLLGTMEKYLKLLTKQDKLGITMILQYIRLKGLEETKRELITNGKFA